MKSHLQCFICILSVCLVSSSARYMAPKFSHSRSNYVEQKHCCIRREAGAHLVYFFGMHLCACEHVHVNLMCVYDPEGINCYLHKNKARLC